MSGEEAEFQDKRLASYRAEAMALRRERDQLSLGTVYTYSLYTEQ